MLKKIWRDVRLSFVSEYQLQTRIAENLQRFPEHHREKVQALAKRHDRLAELTATFPALLFALAITENEDCAKEVSRGIVGGRPLADLAKIGSVPLWLRKLPPEAFHARIPELPNDAGFHRRIANHLPGAENAGKWLEMVGGSIKWCHRDFAIWIARESNNGTSLCSNCLFKLALYAWFSGHPETDAGRLIKTRWNAKMTHDAAKEAQNQWREDLRVHLLLDSVEPEKPWLAPAREGGFTFEPILTAAQVIAESQAMDNCIRMYADEIATRENQFWLVRNEGGERIAHFSIGHRWGEPLPTITEIRGPGNNEVAPDVFRAATVWFVKANVSDRRPFEQPLADIPVRRDLWAKLWRPYWLAKKCLPADLPMTPSLEQI